MKITINEIFLFLLIPAILFVANHSNAATNLKPTTVAELERTSVKIIPRDGRSGGTGSIFRSNAQGSVILTNKHICRIIEQGGYVLKNERKYPITHYKKYKHHDLCLVKTKKNMRINLSIAKGTTRHSQKSIVSGHPNLFPHVVTEGHLSKEQEIELIVGFKKCTKDDYKENARLCWFFKGMPVIKKFNSQFVSNLIMPGNSGSAVFNKDGEVIGVVFAGYGRGLGFGYIVPHIYVVYFIDTQHRYKWIKVGTKVDNKGFDRRFFYYRTCRQLPAFESSKVKDAAAVCKRVMDSMIWLK